MIFLRSFFLSRSGRQMGGMGGSVGGGGMMGPNDFDMPYNTYGLSTSFLESLGINGPLHNKVFVANVSICIFYSCVN